MRSERKRIALTRSAADAVAAGMVRREDQHSRVGEGQEVDDVGVEPGAQVEHHVVGRQLADLVRQAAAELGRRVGRGPR
jgi:hypothetical protein